MRGSKNFARVVQARLPENSSNNVFVFFCPQLLQFYSGLSMIYFKEIYNFTRFRGGGGGGGGGAGGGVQPIPRDQTFSMGEGAGGGGGGVQMLILETHRTCDFPGGVRTLYFSSGSAHVTI